MITHLFGLQCNTVCFHLLSCKCNTTAHSKCTVLKCVSFFPLHISLHFSNTTCSDSESEYDENHFPVVSTPSLAGHLFQYSASHAYLGMLQVFMKLCTLMECGEKLLVIHCSKTNPPGFGSTIYILAPDSMLWRMHSCSCSARIQ